MYAVHNSVTSEYMAGPPASIPGLGRRRTGTGADGMVLCTTGARSDRVAGHRCRGCTACCPWRPGVKCTIQCPPTTAPGTDVHGIARSCFTGTFITASDCHTSPRGALLCRKRRYSRCRFAHSFNLLSGQPCSIFDDLMTQVRTRETRSQRS